MKETVPEGTEFPPGWEQCGQNTVVATELKLQLGQQVLKGQPLY